MEKKSLIHLIEDEVDKEDDDLEEIDSPEIDRLKKRYHLAFSILNFVTNRHAKKTEESEDQILSKLFDTTNEDQIKEMDSLIKTEDPVKLASSVVENRISQLEEQTKEFGADPDLITENQDKIKDLEDIQYYLMSDNLEPEIISVSRIETPTSKVPIKTEAIETGTRSKTRQQPEIVKSKKTKKTKQQSPKFESHTKTSLQAEKVPASQRIIESAPGETKISPIVQPEPLAQARERLETLYIGRPETPILKTETVTIKQEDPISETKYRDISKKIVIDNLSLRQFFNKNHFNEQARKRIISEILAGEKPAKVLGKEMKRRGKFKQLIGAYSKNEPAAISLPNNPIQQAAVKPPKQPVSRKNYPSVSFYSSRIWSVIVIGVVIVLLILFMIFK